MNKQRLQELAGIKVNELQVNIPKPKIFEIDEIEIKFTYVELISLEDNIEDLKPDDYCLFEVYLDEVNDNEFLKLESLELEDGIKYLNSLNYNGDVEMLELIYKAKNILNKYKIKHHLLYNSNYVQLAIQYKYILQYS